MMSLSWILYMNYIEGRIIDAVIYLFLKDPVVLKGPKGSI